MAKSWARIALDVPLFSFFDYIIPSGMKVKRGQRVIVDFGKKELIGVVVNILSSCEIPEDKQKPLKEVIDDLPPFSEKWLKLCEFAANYYIRPVGEVILPVIAPPLRNINSYRGKTKTSPVERLDKRKIKIDSEYSQNTAPELNDDQLAAANYIKSIKGYETVVLHGITGSGKTEVYLNVAEHILSTGKQVLFLVPEINLTPQFEQLIRHRFSALYGQDAVVTMHSGLSDGQRLKSWVRMCRQEAKILVGTRMSIFSPFENIGLIIVDEEHDASYKQQDGLRYSARDLAIWRANQLEVPVVLGSATPSLETWRNMQTGRYKLLSLKKRASSGNPPQIHILNTKKLKSINGIAQPLFDLISKKLSDGEQVMIYLNRRGFAPVLRCGSCGWVSTCPNCSVHTVMHRNIKRDLNILQCHHCGFRSHVPLCCPDCGEVDLSALGYGTQKIEEGLINHFPDAKILRIDADSTRLKGSAERLFTQATEGHVDIIIGTQMLAKGHDFKKLSLVAVLNSDLMLYNADFRSSERLFSQLLQVAGRAGRHIKDAKVVVQTEFDRHPVYDALIAQDYEQFSQSALEERKSATLPPYSYQILFTAQSKKILNALEFLEQVASIGANAKYEDVRIYDPVPLQIVRVANVERAQLLFESQSRTRLHSLVYEILPHIDNIKSSKISYHIEVDPLTI
ncbi:replication restart helicase PriA [Taylorella equigenitalis]|uniref:replication restart helicase PriA n=1 Tax=Taylorella equigenitalis TaxID=29575 RepID=UPI00040823F3|nr:primosomal protein N' [Taylorella equigenitalis]ASY37287.1 primosomal protein N' [Taylorella equigenitalis]KGK33515.1 primosomal protein DnaI [Taylorella equigenitalis]WDU46575.1 primosomal protein N' [Taylorella equigenitalis]